MGVGAGVVGPGVSRPPGGGSSGGAVAGTSLAIDVPADNIIGVTITDASGEQWVFQKTGAGNVEFLQSGGGGMEFQSVGGAVAFSAPGGSIEFSTPDNGADKGGSITLDAGNADSTAALLLICDGNGGLQLYDNGDVDGSSILSLRLPTSDPGTPGQLWNDAGTVKVSA